MSCRIPLHISPLDRSPSAIQARLELAIAMGQLNPNGFRKPGKRPGSTSMAERLAKQLGMKMGGQERSERSIRKARRRADHIENVLAQNARRWG
jgi:hypothetical protein